MKVTPITASRFMSDGGSMFGLVPKPIWSKLIPADERNRIHQDAHALLVQLDDGRKGLIDTGCGSAEMFSPKELELNGLGPGWPLAERLKALGTDPEEIAFVVFSHLHWDHAGGASAGTPGERIPFFPGAEHFVHAREWEDATSGDPLLYKSYPAEVTAPLKTLAAGKLKRVRHEREEILPGITLVHSGGHTRGHCVVVLEHRDAIELAHPEALFLFPPRRLVFAGDVCPMQHSLRMVFQTSYDTYPLETRKWKRTWLPELAAGGSLLMFDHDPELFGATLKADERKEFVVEKTLHTEMAGPGARSLTDFNKSGLDRSSSAEEPSRG